jgi:hypothetical protein
MKEHWLLCRTGFVDREATWGGKENYILLYVLLYFKIKYLFATCKKIKNTLA